MNFLQNIFGNKRSPTPQELKELQELNRLALVERFKATQFKNNTMVLNPDGQKLAEQQDKIAVLLENIRNSAVQRLFVALGYKQGENLTINLDTGSIKKGEKQDEPRETQKTS